MENTKTKFLNLQNSKRVSQKRGQITIFVILGLVILLAAATIIYLVNQDKGFEEPKITQLPGDFEPVREHVKQCMEITLIDALQEIGLHGGYISPEDKDLTKKEFKHNIVNYQQTQLVRFIKEDEQTSIPLYLYLDNSNTCANCVISSEAPSKKELEEQITLYMNKNMKYCLNFGDIRNINIKPSPEYSFEVELTNSSVAVIYNRKIDMSIDNRQETVSTFFIKPDIPFLRLYEEALAITNKEFQSQFLENYLMYLISAYSGIDSKLPPIAAHNKGFDYSIWVLNDVQETYNKILSTYSSVLRVTNTTNGYNSLLGQDPSLQGFLDITKLDLFNSTEQELYSTKDQEINFYHANYLDLDIAPRNGLLLKPQIEKQGGILFIPPEQNNYYTFFYTISNPFIISIKQKDIYPGLDLDFVFALEANLINNKNLQELFMGRGIIPWSNSFVNVNINNPAENLDPLTECADIEDEEMKKACLDGDYSSEDDGVKEYAYNESVPSLFCREEAKSEGPFLIRTFEDDSANKPLEQVSLTYSCGYYGDCNLGVTRNDTYNVYSVFNGKLPACQGGLLKLEKEGYNSKTVEFSTIGSEKELAKDIRLKKIYQKNISLELVQVNKQKNSYGFTTYSASAPRELNDKEKAIITFIRKDNDVAGEYEEPLSSSIIISNETLPEDANINLIAGSYDITVTYLDEGGITIPAKCKKICSKRGLLGCSSYTYLPKDPVEIETAPWGGNEQKSFAINKNDLEANNKLVIPILRMPDPECLDDLESMGETESFSRRFGVQSKPRFE